jgi:hypothetical protein
MEEAAPKSARATFDRFMRPPRPQGCGGFGTLSVERLLVRE